MKNRLKLFGIIAAIAVIGFSMAACDNGTIDDTNVGGGGGGTTVNLPDREVTVTIRNDLIPATFAASYERNILGFRVFVYRAPGNRETVINDSDFSVTSNGEPISLTFTLPPFVENGVQIGYQFSLDVGLRHTSGSIPAGSGTLGPDRNARNVSFFDATGITTPGFDPAVTSVNMTLNLDFGDLPHSPPGAPQSFFFKAVTE